MTRIHLASGLAIHDGAVLLVASSYASHDVPLWNLPGGRQQHGELLRETAVREVYEETGLTATILDLAYVSESYDGDTHFLSTVFLIETAGTLRAPLSDDHVAEAAWCPLDQLRSRLAVGVVREPLLTYLANHTHYFGVHDAGVTIRWRD
ncbi:MAG: NUDIX hydrolase [Candidatus Eremiobacteraeota bacterium]|nr:NUDIX hydrolase [Candidatus Eremiobacteraeota bacterium]